MPKYVIEREIPEAGKLTPRDLKAIAMKSKRVLDELGTRIQWQHSYVTTDKLYCIYLADDEALIHEHARRGDFPVTSVARVGAVIDAVTAD
ncbi:MAG TPA: DUF4242 domain-containing protein [Methylibium sp.]|uniref:DUF4242 domain-containing protein n=1 Tax=Methylibium sp. TaxID=2067992 RepID=UPI002DB75E6B|nr:DUF4242 domain-containing protein [Methylibium sp.]HEU4458511.1 DUF4242 domain-containing protein [Methylibium sp.]